MLGSTQLVQHLKLLQSEEMSAVKNFVKSQATKRQKPLLPFLEQLLLFFPDFNITDEDEKKIIRKLVPGVRYDKAQRKIGRWSKQLLPILKRYLLQVYLDRNTTVEKDLLRTIYLEKGQMPLYQYALKQQLAEHHKNKDWIKYHELEYRAAAEQLSSSLIDGYEYQKPSLEETAKYLELFFSWQRIQLELDELNRTHIYNQEEAIKKYFAAHSWETLKDHYEDIPATLTAYQMVRSALSDNNQDQQAIQATINYLTQHIQQLGKQDAGLLIRQLLNICNRQLKNGNLIYLEKTLQLYQLGLEQGVFMENNKLPVRLFMNIATIGDAAGAYDWVEAFLTEYEDQLDSQYQTVGQDLAWAGHYFHQGSTQGNVNILLEAAEKLPAQHQLPVWFSLRRYSLDIRIQLEVFLHDDSAEPEPVELAIKRFTRYLQRNQTLNQATIALYLQGIQGVRILFEYEQFNRRAYASKEGKQDLAREARQLLQEPKLPWKPWLSQKAEDILP